MLKQTNIKFKRRLMVAGLTALVLTILAPVMTHAGGPTRDTYTMEKPADHVTFNSITDNPVLGDERNFVRVAEVGANGKFADEIKIVPGKEYEVYIGYHNNAASSLNGTAAGGKGIALDVRISSQFPSAVSASKKGKVSAIISSSNATPTEVWDEAYFTTDSKDDVVLRYVEDSATIYNGGKINNTKLAGEYLFSEDGVYIGFNKLSGSLPGCAEYSGHIIYRVRAEQIGAKVTKSASTDGVNFFKVVNPKPGDTVTYKVEFENTGTVDLTKVTFHDKLPSGVTLIPGTTLLVNNANPNGVTMADTIGQEGFQTNANPNGVTMADTIGQEGFQTGLYGAGAKATLTYKVKVNDDVVANGVCGTNQFVNTIYVDHNDGEISDTSTLEIERTCTEGEEPGDPPAELPKTGPAEIALAIIAGVCVVVGAVYWYYSQKELNTLKKSATNGKKH